MKVMDMLVEIPEGNRADGLLTVDDVLSMPPSRGYRFELHEGVLRMMPPAAWRHQKIASRLERYFEESGREVCQNNGIRFDDKNYRVPDVLVLKPGAVVDEDKSVHSPGLFEIVVEVVSPGSADEDRLIKSKVYATAGIQEYWIVERRPDAYVVAVGHLHGDHYVQVREVELEDLLAGGGGLG
jgi:Uma2 family endonuclease